MSSKILFGTLIGYWVEVVEASNKNYVGLKGRVVDETRNMLIIDTGDAIKKIVKEGCIFRLIKDGEHILIKGEDLVGDVVRRVIRIG